MEIKTHHKLIINQAIQKVYNRVKQDYQGLVTIVLALNPEMVDTSHLPFFDAHDLKINVAPDYFVEPCRVIILVRDVTIDGVAFPLAVIALEDKGYSVHSAKKDYCEIVNL